MKNQSRISSLFRGISVLTSASLFASCFICSDAFTVHAETYSGACGENATWSFEDGTLTISGEGETSDYYHVEHADSFVSYDEFGYEISTTRFYSTCDTPWYGFREEIQTIVIEGDITSIGTNLFRDCDNVTSVTMPDSVKEIRGEAFRRCENLTNITLPNSLQRIGAYAFHYCINLTDITFPDSLQTIVHNAFNSCKSLTELNLPDSLQSVGVSAFSGCESLTSVTVPDSVQEIGDSAFAYCHNLTTVTLPSTLERIGSWLFNSCENLTTLNLPDSLRSIEIRAFDGCNALIAAHSTDDGYVLVNGKYLIGCNEKYARHDIPEGTVLIADSALRELKVVGRNAAAIEINCPESLRVIGAEAFLDCTRMVALNLNDGLERIGENALSGCSSLTTLVIPASVTEIGEQAGCSLTDIYGTPGTAAEQFARENDIAFHDAAKLANPPQGRDMTLDLSADIWSFGNAAEIFGSSYDLTEADRQRLIDRGFDPKDAGTAWNGSCVGLAVTVILAKNGVFLPAWLQSGAQSLAEVEAADAVKSFINYFQCIQGGGTTGQSYELHDQRFYRMLKIAENIPNGESPFLLTFAITGGSHAVVGYGMESGEWEFDGVAYDGRILVWDSNFPDALHEESCLYYDSKTFAYCIPQYGVEQEAGDSRGGIITVSNDLAVLNAYPYPFAAETGDLDGDGTLTSADAVLLARVLAEDPDAKVPAPACADVDADGLLTLLDLRALLQELLA